MLGFVSSSTPYLMYEWLESRRKIWRDHEFMNRKFSGYGFELCELLSNALDVRKPSFKAMGLVYWIAPRLFRLALGSEINFQIKQEIVKINYAAFGGEFELARELLTNVKPCLPLTRYCIESSESTSYYNPKYIDALLKRIGGKQFDLIISPAHGAIRNGLIASLIRLRDFWPIYYSVYDSNHKIPAFEVDEVKNLIGSLSNKPILIYDENISRGRTLYGLVKSMRFISPDAPISFCASAGVQAFIKKIAQDPNILEGLEAEIGSIVCEYFHAYNPELYLPIDSVKEINSMFSWEK